MTVTTIQASGQRWRYAPDDPQPTVAERSQVILQAQLVDEVLNAAPTQPLSVTTSVRGAIARSAGGGRVGVIGRPALIYYSPDIKDGEADLTVAADGFLPLHIKEKLGIQPPDYPHAFDYRDLPKVPLHRRPVRLTGRVISRSAGALTGATVAVSKVWMVLKQPAGPSAQPNAMPLLAGLYQDRKTGTAQRQNFSFAPEKKSLLRGAAAGDVAIHLSDRINLDAAQVLAIESGDLERLELIGIASIPGGTTADRPTEIILDHPLRRDHPQGAIAARAITSGGTGAANNITRPARQGDATIWLAGLNGIGPGTGSIVISGGGHPDEYQPTAPYSVKSLSNGQYMLPPIHRIAAVQLTASHPSQPTSIVRKVMLAWNSATQTEDFVFP
jgi:hypothetical protein